MRADLAITGHRVVRAGTISPATLLVRDGRIVQVLDRGTVFEADKHFDFGQAAVLPGLVDTHVHINEPGRGDWEGFRTATRAAARGGVTTVVDMPLNSVPPTVNVSALDAKRAASAGSLWVDVGLWGGVVPGNAEALAPLFRRGVPGFKCFLVPSGVDEFPHVDESDLRKALPVIAELGAVLLAHAELPGPLQAAERQLAGMDPRAYSTYLASRPPAAEVEAVELLVRLCRDTGAKIHVVHFACADALGLIEDAKAEGLPITAETCPHYLYFDAESIEDGRTAFKCAPPIRERSHQRALRQALRKGTLDFLVSDHSPCTPNLKLFSSGDFMKAWGGIGSLELGLGVAWTLAEACEFGLIEIAHWMSEAPANFAGLSSSKGSLDVGKDADIVVFDTVGFREVSDDSLAQKNPVTPYAGQTLRGRVTQTIVRGKIVYDRGEFAAEPHGRLAWAR